jgi:hypothetical protein
MTCAMNDVEASIVNILEATAYKGIFFPRELLHEIEDCIYRCHYKNALWKITNYLDPFDTIDVALLVESWELLCQYTQRLLEKFEREYEQDCANGGRGVFVAPLDIPTCLKNTKSILNSCQAGKRKAMRMQEYRQQQCESAASSTQQARMFKAKCN